MKTILLVFICVLLFLMPQPIFALKYLKTDTSEAKSIAFLNFEAVSSARIIHFKWNVEWEHEGSYFIIEKSIDDEKSWQEISRVRSIGNHDELYTYEISEINLVEEAREIFRISRLDRNGVVQELDKIEVHHPVLFNLKLIPNPKRIKKSVRISYESLIESNGHLYVYDEENNLVLMRSLTLNDGYNRVELGIKKFRSGRYRIVIRNEFNESLSRILTVH